MDHAHSEEEVLVLLSGGIDSAACVAFFRDEMNRPPRAMFIEHGQRASHHEELAAEAVARHYDLPLAKHIWRGSGAKPKGEIVGRNIFLLSAALMELPSGVTTIAIGLHAGVDYPDCSLAFVETAQSVIKQSSSGRIHFAVPFIEWTKSEVFAFCRLHSVPINLTYSCEQGGDTPCGQCLSCKDREAWHACA